MKKCCLFALLCGMLSGWPMAAFSQPDYLPGYQKDVSGTRFAYHSLFSFSEASLLARARAEFPPIEWETEVVPAEYEGQTVSFCWMYGMDVNPHPESFDLWIDGVKTLSFSNPVAEALEAIEIEGVGGSRLVFHPSFGDKYGDHLGFAVLTLPVTPARKGKPVRLKVDGADHQSDAWYMTYQVKLDAHASAMQSATVTKKDGGLYHGLSFSIIHLSSRQEAVLSANGIRRTLVLQTGLNEAELLLPAVAEPTRVTAALEIPGRETRSFDVMVNPVKEWTLDLVQHTHTDIGYTRPQAEILAEHLRYIDLALDYCDLTDSFPEEARFRWTCETSWAVREYFRNRPEAQRQRLLMRMREGRIEVAGMMFNYSDVVDETALAWQLLPLKLLKEAGAEVTTAMQNDVNGIGWCMPDLFQHTGVKYLVMGQHGHRAHIPFDKPTVFRWESPSGKSLLAYRGEHYMHGNTLGLTSGDAEAFRKNLAAYLRSLEQNQYPFDRISIQFSGYVTDNSPPSLTACEFVKQWNERYAWPKLRLSLARDFMAWADSLQPGQIETRRLAWPDWWTDGFGTAMNETKAARTVHADLTATTGLLALAVLKGATVPSSLYTDIEQCYDNLLLYDEHTFGAAESITEPMCENSVNQWNQKSAYIWSAVQQSGLLREKVMGLLDPYLPVAEMPTITVLNTLGQRRSGMAEVFINHEMLSPGKAFRIMDSDGREVPARVMNSRSEGSYWALWVRDVPPLGSTTLRILKGEAPVQAQPEKETVYTGVLENEWYRIRIDAGRGGITQIFDKQLNRELTDATCREITGGLIWERPENRQVMERLTHLNRDTVYVPFGKEIDRLSAGKVVKTEDGPLWQGVTLNGRLDGCAADGGVDIEIRLYRHTRKIELLYRLQKIRHFTPEGLYVAFPFAMPPDGELAFEVQGGVVRPGIDQLPGTATDWNTLQNFACLRNAGAQIIFSSPDVPLVHFGEINTGRFYYRRRPATTHLYAWVLNNYWTTNFKAGQEGELRWRFDITSIDDPSPALAAAFGQEQRIPPVGRVRAEGKTRGTAFFETALKLSLPVNLMLVNMRPMEERRGILIQLRETDGKATEYKLPSEDKIPGICTFYEACVYGEPIGPSLQSIQIAPLETRFLLLKPE